MQTASTEAARPVSPVPAQPSKLLDQARRCIRDKHHSLRTEEAYVYWIRWYIWFHKLKHPMDMGTNDVKAFLSYLTNERQISVSIHK